MCLCVGGFFKDEIFHDGLDILPVTCYLYYREPESYRIVEL